jgi:hypothetical protein
MGLLPFLFSRHAILWHEHEKATEPGRKPAVKKLRGKRSKTST